MEITFELTEELAIKADRILKDAYDNNGLADICIQSEQDRDLYDAIFDLLEKMGYGKAVANDVFQIYPSGMRCILTGGFTAMYKGKVEKRKREEQRHELTSHQLKAAKREPYLIAWSIITSISTLVLGWITFFK